MGAVILTNAARFHLLILLSVCFIPHALSQKRPPPKLAGVPPPKSKPPSPKNNPSTATPTAKSPPPFRPKIVPQLPGELERMQAYIQKMRVPSVKTITSPDGDIIDCVRIQDQAAFKNPSIKAQAPKAFAVPQTVPGGRSRRRKLLQWRQTYMANGTCDVGTIPVLRRTLSMYQQYPTLNAYLNKYHDSVPLFKRENLPTVREMKMNGMFNASNVLRRSKMAKPYIPGSQHEYGVGYQMSANKGVRSSLNVWKPYVEMKDSSEFSLSQVWVVAHPSVGTHTIEAGWQVSPGFYQTDSPRLFIYWTADSYQDTGCYNLDCPAFIQTSNKHVLGGALSVPNSVRSGAQYTLDIIIYKHRRTGHWWLLINGEYVGMWPKTLWSNGGLYGLENFADYLSFGGEVVNSWTYKRHTKTMMGSGLFPAAGHRRAAYQSRCGFVDLDNKMKNASGMVFTATNPKCYDVMAGNKVTNPNLHEHFFFGGPGYNAFCQA